MAELKAYSCMETESGEWTGAIIFAKSNLEARKEAANDFNNGELGGLQVKRAPWADEYGARHKVPISEMIHHGWHFECHWSGQTINLETYEYGIEIYNQETKEYHVDESTIRREPVGFQEGCVFACQEYADNWQLSKKIEQEFNETQLEIYKQMILDQLPDAKFLNEDGYQKRQWIGSRDAKTGDFLGLGERVLSEFHIPIDFPGKKHWAALEFRQPRYSEIGPTRPQFISASGDHEAFTNWMKEQKEKYKL